MIELKQKKGGKMERLWKHLKKGHTITQRQSIAMWNLFSLSAQISKLNAKIGYKIVNLNEGNVNGKYKLKK